MDFALHTPPALPTRPRLAFAETAADAQTVLAAWDERRLDAVVALEPEAAWALRVANRPFLALEDGCDAELIRDLADPVVECQQEWATSVDDWLGRRVPNFGQARFFPAALHLYFLKVMFDSVAIRARMLNVAFAAWQPSFIWYPGPAFSDDRFGSDLLFANSLYPAVLGPVARQFNVEAVLPELPTPGQQDGVAGQRGARASLRRWASASRTQLRSIRRREQAAPVDGGLVLSDHYDLAAVWRAASKQGVPTESWETLVQDVRGAEPVSGGDIGAAMRAAWSEAASGTCLLEPGVVDGCDFRSVVEARVHFWWTTIVPETWAAYQETRRRRASLRPRAVAVSILGGHVERGVFAALRSLGTTTFMYQHGGFVGACECPPWDCNDLRLADCELAYGGGTSRYFDERSRRYPDGRARPISVGSSRLDEWRSSITRGRRTPRRPKVLLVPNLIPRNHRYFDAGTTPDVLESELQLAIVSAARGFPKYSFTFKAFPQADQCRTPAVEIAKRAGSNCRVETRTSIRRLLATADFIVLLFPSTVLLEALLTDRPILVLADPRFLKMRSEAREALEWRAVVADSPEAFLDRYRQLLEEGEFGPIASVDDTFLREYGTHLNDGRSAQRALQAICSTAPGDVASSGARSVQAL